MATTMNTTTRERTWGGLDRRATVEVDTGHFDVAMQKVGNFILRYGLALIFVWIGLLKFTAYEAANIEPLVSTSPILLSAYESLGITNFSGMVGIIEIVIGVLIATRAFAPRLSAVGSFGAIVLFLVTLSFMFTAPGVWEAGYGFPALSALPGQFLAKDLVLLGASVWTFGEALRAARMRATRSADRYELAQKHRASVQDANVNL